MVGLGEIGLEIGYGIFLTTFFIKLMQIKSYISAEMFGNVINIF